ncbi:MAG: hypothetical protein M5R42_08155 [Rhodocyclaceae bacterium]|nr:hypothetical protein [Rhodocyclaceae bacterium]
MAQLSFALNHYFSGFAPFAFKATNLAIHALCGAGILAGAAVVGRATFRNAAAPALALAGLVASLWLLHPIQLTPVLHVVQPHDQPVGAFSSGRTAASCDGARAGGAPELLGLMIAWGCCGRCLTSARRPARCFPPSPWPGN